MYSKNTGKRHDRVPKWTADPSSPGSSRQNDQSSRRSLDDGISEPWAAQERFIGYRETRSARSNGGVQARRCRSPSRADKNLDAQVKSARGAPSRARKYKDIIGAIDILDDVVQMYEVTADKFRRTAAWEQYGKPLYKNILKALRRLASLSPELPSPGLMLAEVKVAENLRTALETIDPKGLLSIMRDIEFGMEGGDVMRLRMRLQPWVTDGGKTTKRYLQKFHQC